MTTPEETGQCLRECPTIAWRDALAVLGGVLQVLTAQRAATGMSDGIQRTRLQYLDGEHDSVYRGSAGKKSIDLSLRDRCKSNRACRVITS